MGDLKKGALIPLVIGVIVVVIVIVIITNSYADLHFYEMGFVKTKITGAVDTSKVYTGGRRWLGPGNTLKAFETIGQEIVLNGTTVFAAADDLNNNQQGSSGAALTLTISAHIIYFLTAEDLALLHDEYDINYHELMRSSAQAALKDTASKFTFSDYYTEREMVESELLLGVQQRLGGICCPVGCEVPSCWAGCKPRPTCNDTEKGLFVDARYLQLTDLEIPYEVEQRNLKTLIITEETAKETFQQQAAVIEKETEQIVEEIQNSAREVTANATARAQLITAKSQANYQKILEEARRSGLVELFTSVGLSDEEQKNSFDYLRSLGDNSQAHLAVDFDQLIMGPTKLP